MRVGVLLVAIGTLLPAGERSAPKFEDYPARSQWSGKRAPVKLIGPSERMFRTRLTEAAAQPPNFASHYRVSHWGCGSECEASAVVDLESGEVFPPPLGGHGPGWRRWINCAASFENTGSEYRVDSRLMIIKCGQGVPDVLYFVWENHRFRKVREVRSSALE